MLIAPVSMCPCRGHVACDNGVNHVMYRTWNRSDCVCACVDTDGPNLGLGVPSSGMLFNMSRMSRSFFLLFCVCFFRRLCESHRKLYLIYIYGESYFWITMLPERSVFSRDSN